MTPQEIQQLNQWLQAARAGHSTSPAPGGEHLRNSVRTVLSAHLATARMGAALQQLIAAGQSGPLSGASAADGGLN